jgi:hypothetical protein
VIAEHHQHAVVEQAVARQRCAEVLERLVEEMRRVQEVAIVQSLADLLGIWKSARTGCAETRHEKRRTISLRERCAGMEATWTD